MSARHRYIIGVRVAVFVLGGAPVPDRVRVVLKELDKGRFSLRRKLATVSLHDATWTPVSNDVWRAEARHHVNINLHKLLRLAEHKRLALQVLCLRGRIVQYKAPASFQLLLNLTEEQECFLPVHYPGVCHHLQPAAEDAHHLETAAEPAAGDSHHLENVAEPAAEDAHHVDNAAEPAAEDASESRRGTARPRKEEPVEVRHAASERTPKKVHKVSPGKASQLQGKVPWEESTCLYFCLLGMAVLSLMSFGIAAALRPVLGVWAPHTWKANVGLGMVGAKLTVWYARGRRERHGGRWSSPRRRNKGKAKRRPKTQPSLE